MAVTGLPLALKSPGAPRRAFDNFWARWFTAADGFVGTRVLAALTPITPPTHYHHHPPRIIGFYLSLIRSPKLKLGQAFKGDLFSEATQDVGYCQARGK